MSRNVHASLQNVPTLPVDNALVGRTIVMFEHDGMHGHRNTIWGPALVEVVAMTELHVTNQPAGEGRIFGTNQRLVTGLNPRVEVGDRVLVLDAPSVNAAVGRPGTVVVVAPEGRSLLVRFDEEVQSNDGRSTARLGEEGSRWFVHQWVALGSTAPEAAAFDPLRPEPGVTLADMWPSSRGFSGPRRGFTLGQRVVVEDAERSEVVGGHGVLVGIEPPDVISAPFRVFLDDVRDPMGRDVWCTAVTAEAQAEVQAVRTWTRDDSPPPVGTRVCVTRALSGLSSYEGRIGTMVDTPAGRDDEHGWVLLDEAAPGLINPMYAWSTLTEVPREPRRWAKDGHAHRSDPLPPPGTRVRILGHLNMREVVDREAVVRHHTREDGQPWCYVSMSGGTELLNWTLIEEILDSPVDAGGAPENSPPETEESLRAELQRLQARWTRLWEVAAEEAADQEWCGEYEEFVERVGGLSLRRRNYRFTIEYTVDIGAGDLDDLLRDHLDPNGEYGIDIQRSVEITNRITITAPSDNPDAQEAGDLMDAEGIEYGSAYIYSYDRD